MGFSLEEVNATDFNELIACEWLSYENPYQSFFRLFCPIHGEGPEARAQWLAEATARQRAWHESDPASYWQKAVETDTGRIVGGALWKIYEQNPFAVAEQHEVSWYPADSTREFVSKALEQFDAPRVRMAQRPQVCTMISSRWWSPVDANVMKSSTLYSLIRNIAVRVLAK